MKLKRFETEYVYTTFTTYAARSVEEARSVLKFVELLNPVMDAHDKFREVVRKQTDYKIPDPRTGEDKNSPEVRKQAEDMIKPYMNEEEDVPLESVIDFVVEAWERATVVNMARGVGVVGFSFMKNFVEYYDKFKNVQVQEAKSRKV